MGRQSQAALWLGGGGVAEEDGSGCRGCGSPSGEELATTRAQIDTPLH